MARNRAVTLDLFSADQTPPASEPVPPSLVNLFAGFADHMEAKEPGYKARMAQERAEKERQWARYCLAVIEKYGSEEVARAPTTMEQAIDAAIEAMSYEEAELNSTYRSSKVPNNIRRAVEDAWPLPYTITAAKAEYDLWQERNDELAAAWDGERGDEYLSTACHVREQIVRDLFETGLRARSIAEVIIRHDYFCDADFHMTDVAQAILADLRHLANA